MVHAFLFKIFLNYIHILKIRKVDFFWKSFSLLRVRVIEKIRGRTVSEGRRYLFGCVLMHCREILKAESKSIN